MNKYFASIGEKEISFTISDDGILGIDTFRYFSKVEKINKHHYKIISDNAEQNVIVNNYENGNYGLLVDGVYVDLKIQSPLQKYAEELMEKSVSAHKHHIVKSPMPGMVLKIKVEVGTHVKKGESVMILEAMKMENEIKTHADGIIKKIFVSEGAAVEKNVQLFEME